MSLGGLRDRTVEYTTWVKGITVFAHSITTENFEAKLVRLHSFSATPGKQCLPPEVSLGGLRDRTVESTTWVLGIQYLLNLSIATENFEYTTWVVGITAFA